VFGYDREIDEPDGEPLFVVRPEDDRYETAIANDVTLV
jgi:hypothetical protein